MNAILSKILPGLLGDKTCTTIGIILGYIISVYADFSKFVPAKYASAVAIGIGTLTAIFGAYVVRPGSSASASNASASNPSASSTPASTSN